MHASLLAAFAEHPYSDGFRETLAAMHPCKYPLTTIFVIFSKNFIAYDEKFNVSAR